MIVNIYSIYTNLEQLKMIERYQTHIKIERLIHRSTTNGARQQKQK